MVDSDRYKWMNKPLALRWASLSIGTLLGERGGGYLTGDFEEKVNYQGMWRRRKPWKWVSLSSYGPHWGTWGGSVYWELWEIVEGGLQKWSISLCRSSVRGNWRGRLLYWGSRRICKELWRRACLYMGALLGNLEGGSFTRDTPFLQLRRSYYHKHINYQDCLHSAAV